VRVGFVRRRLLRYHPEVWKMRPIIICLFALVPWLPAVGQSLGEAPYVATLWNEGDPGERLEIRGIVMDAKGKPVAGAEVSTRQADGGGTYTGQYQATMITNARGEYVLRTALPGNYGVPMHIHVSATHPGAGYAYTEIRFKGDPLLPPGDVEEAIALETVRIDGREHKVGTFHITLKRN
jgi:protocatechuate 3,4-dioxygenase beta subunit